MIHLQPFCSFQWHRPELFFPILSTSVIANSPSELEASRAQLRLFWHSNDRVRSTLAAGTKTQEITMVAEINTSMMMLSSMPVVVQALHQLWPLSDYIRDMKIKRICDQKWVDRESALLTFIETIRLYSHSKHCIWSTYSIRLTLLPRHFNLARKKIIEIFQKKIIVASTWTVRYSDWRSTVPAEEFWKRKVHIQACALDFVIFVWQSSQLHGVFKIWDCMPQECKH